MNVLFISPNFPPTYYLFAVRLREEGATVLGIGDAPGDALRPELRAALHDYVHVPHMDDYDQMLRATALLISRHGRIERLDSNNEHWLPLEARLREDFNVAGQRPADTAVNRSKSRMKEVLRRAGLPCGPGEPLADLTQARRFAAAHGYPLVLKPDVGVGAAGALRVDDDAALAAAVARVGAGYVVEKFLFGDLISFDGLTDDEGEIVFSASHVFSEGILEIVSGRRPMHYYSLRDVPEDLERLGRRIVAAFGVRGRFFHVELFRLADGSLSVLEVNVRPPGGYTTDLMNWSADADVYRLWAKVVTGRLHGAAPLTRRYHAAHVGRRNGRRYARSHEEIVRLLGDRLLMHAPVPDALSGAMGDYLYLLRARDLAELKGVIGEIERET